MRDQRLQLPIECDRLAEILDIHQWIYDGIEGVRLQLRLKEPPLDVDSFMECHLKVVKHRGKNRLN